MKPHRSLSRTLRSGRTLWKHLLEEYSWGNLLSAQWFLADLLVELLSSCDCAHIVGTGPCTTRALYSLVAAKGLDKREKSNLNSKCCAISTSQQDHFVSFTIYDVSSDPFASSTPQRRNSFKWNRLVWKRFISKYLIVCIKLKSCKVWTFIVGFWLYILSEESKVISSLLEEGFRNIYSAPKAWVLNVNLNPS